MIITIMTIISENTLEHHRAEFLEHCISYYHLTSVFSRVRNSVTREEFGVESLLLHIERGSAEVVWASASVASWTPPSRGVLGMSHLEETWRKTQEVLGPCLSAGLGTPWGPSG